MGQGNDMIVLWGSQSGTAEGFAHRLANELQVRFGMKVSAADLDDYDHESLVDIPEDKTVALILSTYGEGDAPDNTNAFLKALAQLRGNKTRLTNLRYVIFGLGNRNYRWYNRVADVVDSSLQELAATRIGPVGKADDSSGSTEEDFMTWKQDISSVLQRTLKLKGRRRAYQPSLIIEEKSGSLQENGIYLGEPHSSLLAEDTTSKKRVRDPKVPIVMPIVEARELFTSGKRSCLHLELDLQSAPWVKYQTGDHIAIWPSNPDVDVESVLHLLGLDSRRNACVAIAPHHDSGTKSSTWPNPTTIESLFRYYLEIRAPVSRDLLAGIAEFAPDNKAKAQLDRLATDAQAFKIETSRRYLTIGHVLQRFGGERQWQIPLSFVVENLKRTKPRYYSISSSAIVQPRRASITAVVNVQNLQPATTSLGSDVMYGLTSNYLLALKQSVDHSNTGVRTPRISYNLSGPRNLLAGNKIFAQVRRSAFKLPPKSSTSVIMIGAGTGAAPFRAFVQERARLKEMGKPVGKTILALGFRRREEDFLYADDWAKYTEVLGENDFKTWTAFSREDLKTKVYVQHCLEKNATVVLRLLREDDRSVVYVCGSAGMARDVVSSLARCWAQEIGESQEKADQWVTTLRHEGRLQEDVWG